MTETFAERWTALFERCTIIAKNHGCCPTNLAASIADAEGWWDNDAYEAMLKEQK
tara:strand:- start:453 stop:617 length:165 start_codon:yes stop_codon:yes gene_type:complete